MREIVLDTETTGFEPREGHRIVEIGCLELMNHLPTGRSYHVYVNPKRDMPEPAFKVHGLSEAFLSNHPSFDDHAEAFLDFLQDDPLVIHNAKFDMKFINFEIGRLGFKRIPMTRSIDTVLMARKKFPGSPASLDALCRRFNIDLSERNHHGALLDARLLAEVYLELLGGRQGQLDLNAPPLDFKKETSTHSGFIEKTNDFSEHVLRPPRPHKPYDDDAQNHEHYIKNSLKNSMWEKITLQVNSQRG
jgi:DNA polymerase-3 subunit epsilon